MFTTSTALIAKYASTPVAPAPTYTRHAQTDAPCTGCDILKAWSVDLAQLMVLCNKDPTCVGFTTTGYVKNSTATMAPSTLSDLWVKNAATAV